MRKRAQLIILQRFATINRFEKELCGDGRSAVILLMQHKECPGAYDYLDINLLLRLYSILKGRTIRNMIPMMTNSTNIPK